MNRRHKSQDAIYWERRLHFVRSRALYPPPWTAEPDSFQTTTEEVKNGRNA